MCVCVCVAHYSHPPEVIQGVRNKINSVVLDALVQRGIAKVRVCVCALVCCVHACVCMCVCVCALVCCVHACVCMRACVVCGVCVHVHVCGVSFKCLLVLHLSTSPTDRHRTDYHRV